MIFTMGLVFELPIFVVGLVRLGIVSSDKLRHERRIGYGICIVIGVLLPGVDFVSMLLETAADRRAVRSLDLGGGDRRAAHGGAATWQPGPGL